MKKYHVLIIGAGQIGALFDKPKSKDILTHAHAFSLHSKFELIGFFDTDKKKAQKAANIWQTNSFISTKEAFSKHKIDIVCICVPDEYHYSTLIEVIKYKPMLVFTEKPLTKKLSEAREILRLYNKQNIPLLVNYSRRFVPEFLTLKKEISHGKYGKFISGTGFYGKGLLHNGSHMVDLIRYLISDITSVNIIAKTNDYYHDDPSISAILGIKNGGNIILSTINCQYYTIFELDLLFEKGRIRITDSGNLIEKYKITDSAIFKDYKYLLRHDKIQTSLDKSIYFAVENIFSHLKNNQKLICMGKDAYSTLDTTIKIKAKRTL